MIGFSRDDREKQRHRGFIWGMHAITLLQRPPHLIPRVSTG